MYIEKISLKNYRNLTETLLTLNPNLNLFIGNNGQGKTNFLEAIYLLGTSSSHRNSNNKDLITWEKNKSLVQVKLIKKDQTLKISFLIHNNKKTVEINNTPLTKISELLGNLNVVLFSPEDLNLVKGGPEYRRNFLNIEISQVSKYYNHLLHKYNHVLKQRNNLLKNIRDKRSKKDLLAVWDQQLITLGSKIIEKRIEVVEKIKILARLAQRNITDAHENLNLSYDCNLKGNLQKKEISLIFKQDLANNREREIKLGYTLTGPHRDDLVLKVNDIDIRKYGSQGQQRTTALALKLAELEFMKSETGEYPILLLDDVFSELDEKRRNTLIKTINNKIQTIITSTDLNNLQQINNNSYKLFKVKKGVIKEKCSYT